MRLQAIHLQGTTRIHSSYNNFIDFPFSTTTVWGKAVAVLNVDPLTSRIKNYFSCTSLTGAYLEDEGSSGSVASHFERRIFYNEVTFSHK